MGSGKFALVVIVSALFSSETDVGTEVKQRKVPTLATLLGSEGIMETTMGFLQTPEVSQVIKTNKDLSQSVHSFAYVKDQVKLHYHGLRSLQQIANIR